MKYLKLFEAWNDENLDNILDKISKDGYDKLTDEEKQFIEEWYPAKSFKKIEKPTKTEQPIDDILDKISKYGYDKLSDEDKEYINKWYPDKAYKDNIAEYESGKYKVVVKKVKHTETDILFFVDLYDDETRYSGTLVFSAFKGDLRTIDLYDEDSGESFEETYDFYQLVDMFEEILDDYQKAK